MSRDAVLNQGWIGENPPMSPARTIRRSRRKSPGHRLESQALVIARKILSQPTATFLEHRPAAGVLQLGHEAIDSAFPHGGLALGAWHEIGGTGMEAEVCAAPAGFAARSTRC